MTLENAIIAFLPLQMVLVVVLSTTGVGDTHICLAESTEPSCYRFSVELLNCSDIQSRWSIITPFGFSFNLFRTF